MAQNVSNVNATVQDNKIVVDYQLKGGKYNQHFNVSLYVSRDGGETFKGPLYEVKGDVGADIGNGHQTITWDVFSEMPFYKEDLVFDVRVKVVNEKVKKSVFVSLVGNTVTPFGLRIGMLGKVGWYIEARASLMALEKPMYNYENGSIVDYDKHGYYRFTDNEGYSAYSILVGVTFQVSRKVYIYGGVGYGIENSLVEIDEFDYESNTKTASNLVNMNELSNSGFEIDAGVMLRFNKFLISGGATTINFKTINGTIGIGLAF